MLRRQFVTAFTLLELATCIVIIVILAALLIPSFERIREKARGIKCGENLKNLFVATNGYIQDHQRWPQIHGDPNSELFANAWLAALKPYKISEVNWFCPTIQSQMENAKEMPFRLDYIPTPFGSNPRNPFMWPTHPWFSERGSVHSQGNLVIMTNGSVQPLNSISTSSQF